jgi:hypothetical protein
LGVSALLNLGQSAQRLFLEQPLRITADSINTEYEIFFTDCIMAQLFMFLN